MSACCCWRARDVEKRPTAGTEGTALLTGEEDTAQLFEMMPVWAKITVPSLLGISLGLNLIVLCIPTMPFVTLDVTYPLDQFLAPGGYGLSATLEQLAMYDLWFLFVLIVCWSMCFPPVKICMTCVLLVKPMKRDKRGCWLAWLGHLGRWSLLDVYFALLMMIVVYDQGFTITVAGKTFAEQSIACYPEIGIYIFHGAILSSMAAVTICQEQSATAKLPPLPKPPDLRPPPRPLILSAGTHGYVAIALAVTSLTMQLCAVILPAFTIIGIVRDDQPAPIPLKHIEHYLGESIYQTTPLFATDMTLWILIVPNVTMVFCMVALLVPLRPGRWMWVSVRYLSEWSMLDVYVVSMLIYLTQESDLITLDLQAGTFIAFAYVPVMIAAVLVNEKALRTAVENELNPNPPLATPPSRV